MHREQGGRCISEKQEAEIRAKADIIIWCRLGQYLTPNAILNLGEPINVHLMGFSEVEEVLAIPLSNTSFDETPKLNHQVPEANLRPMEELVRRLAS